MNELQGCKSESWLNCLLCRVELGFAPSSAFFLALFSTVCPRGVATMFLPPLLSPVRPLSGRGRASGREKRRQGGSESSDGKVRETTGKLELFITASFPILHGIASAPVRRGRSPIHSYPNAIRGHADASASTERNKLRVSRRDCRRREAGERSRVFERSFLDPAVKKGSNVSAL